MGRIQEIIFWVDRQKKYRANQGKSSTSKTLTVIHKDKELLGEITKLEDYIKGELNIKNVEYSTKEKHFIKLFAKPNSPVLGKKLGKTFGKFMKLITNLKPEEVVFYENTNSIDIDGENFSKGEILIFREPKEGTNTMSNRFISIDLDITLDQELLDEGLAREIVNRIQKTRKEINLHVDDRIKVEYTSDEKLNSVIKKFEDKIMSETLYAQISQGSQDSDDFMENNIEQHQS